MGTLAVMAYCAYSVFALSLIHFYQIAAVLDEDISFEIGLIRQCKGPAIYRTIIVIAYCAHSIAADPVITIQLFPENGHQIAAVLDEHI